MHEVMPGREIERWFQKSSSETIAEVAREQELTRSQDGMEKGRGVSVVGRLGRGLNGRDLSSSARS